MIMMILIIIIIIHVCLCCLNKQFNYTVSFQNFLIGKKLYGIYTIPYILRDRKLRESEQGPHRVWGFTVSFQNYHIISLLMSLLLSLLSLLLLVCLLLLLLLLSFLSLWIPRLWSGCTVSYQNFMFVLAA